MSSRSGGTLSAPAFSWGRRTMFAALVAFAVACMDTNGPPGSPTAPPAGQPTPTPQSPYPPPPDITGPAVLYVRASPSSYGSDAYLMSLGADSAFVIELPNGPLSWGWAGRYERRDSVVIFHYNAWSAAGALGATGIVRGDTMFLKYNVIMQLTDFEDGMYVRSR